MVLCQKVIVESRRTELAIFSPRNQLHPSFSVKSQFQTCHQEYLIYSQDLSVETSPRLETSFNRISQQTCDYKYRPCHYMTRVETYRRKISKIKHFKCSLLKFDLFGSWLARSHEIHLDDSFDFSVSVSLSLCYSLSFSPRPPFRSLFSMYLGLVFRQSAVG